MNKPWLWVHCNCCHEIRPRNSTRLSWSRWTKYDALNNEKQVTADHRGTLERVPQRVVRLCLVVQGAYIRAVHAHMHDRSTPTRGSQIRAYVRLDLGACGGFVCLMCNENENKRLLALST